MTTTESTASEEPVTAATAEDLKRDLLDPKAQEAAHLDTASDHAEVDLLLRTVDASWHAKFQSVLRALQHAHRFGRLGRWMLMHSDLPAGEVFERYPLVRLEEWGLYDDEHGPRVMATWAFAPKWRADRYVRLSVDISYETSVVGERYLSYLIDAIEEEESEAVWV